VCEHKVPVVETLSGITVVLQQCSKSIKSQWWRFCPRPQRSHSEGVHCSRLKTPSRS